MKILAIIQARLDSERLPNKVLLQIPPESGVSMLELVIRKAMLSRHITDVVVVTPDIELVKICKMLNTGYLVKGWKERDVLREFYEAAHNENMHYEEGAIVRLTADCPLLQPEEIDRVVREYVSQRNSWGNARIVYNTDETTGQLHGEGSDVEVFSYLALEMAYKNAKGKEREHVALWMREHLTAKMIQPSAMGLKSVNTLQDYLDVCEIISQKRLAISPTDSTIS